MFKYNIRGENIEVTEAIRQYAEKKISKLEKYFTGTTIKHLTGKSLAQIQIKIPTICEQSEIIRILEQVFEKEEQAQEAAETVIDQIDTMKKAVLARAFRGELGTNDPTEESAVELLKALL